MTKNEAMKLGSTHYIKKPFRKVKYLRWSGGIYWYLDVNGTPFEMCREWMFWIKPL